MNGNTVVAVSQALDLLSEFREENAGISHACTVLVSVLKKDQADAIRQSKEAERAAQEPALAAARVRRVEAQTKLLEERLAAATARRVAREAMADYKIKYAAWLAESKLHPAPGYPNLIETNWARDNRPPVKPC